jgi:hypothetical protein
MAFVAIPLVLSGLSSLGLSYYLYNSTSSDQTVPDAPALDVMEKYSTVMVELKTQSHPILQKLEFSPTLQEIQNTRAGLKPVEIINKSERSLMETFVIALQQRRESLKKIKM